MSTNHTVMDSHTCNITPDPAWCARCATEQRQFRRRSRSRYPRTGLEPSLLSEALTQPQQQPISIAVCLDDSPPFAWSIFASTTVSDLTQQLSAINRAPMAMFLQYDTWLFTVPMRLPMEPGRDVFDYLRDASRMGSDLDSVLLVAQTQPMESIMSGLFGLQL